MYVCIYLGMHVRVHLVRHVSDPGGSRGLWLTRRGQGREAHPLVRLGTYHVASEILQRNNKLNSTAAFDLQQGTTTMHVLYIIFRPLPECVRDPERWRQRLLYYYVW